jgi:hypothetical protein
VMAVSTQKVKFLNIFMYVIDGVDRTRIKRIRHGFKENLILIRVQSLKSVC